MIANLHTHTWRCGHASGTEEAYVQAAIQRGLKQLGFSDHAPYRFPRGYYSQFRMKPQELAHYAQTVLTLRKQFQQRLDIRLGVEMEYYPAYFADTVKWLSDHQIEYLILGQHFPGNEIGEDSCAMPTQDEARLERYCRQLLDAVHTGLFSYVAHPDMFRFVGEPAIYRKHLRPLLREIRACGLPVEINLLGVAENRHYPNPIFWECAAEAGCKAVLGCDAHKAEALLDTASAQRALDMAARLGIEVLDTVALRSIG